MRNWHRELAEVLARCRELLAAPVRAVAARPADHAVFTCCLCGAVAGRIELSGRRRVRIRREGQTSVLYAPVPRKAVAGLRAALGRGDLPAIFAVDLEYLPNWCPECGLTYCVAHWVRWSVFDDDGWHDSIRGRCPSGHERMLED